MPLEIYGVARSRAFRTLWMAAELGLDYRLVKVDFADGGTRRPEFLAINPNGHVPVIDDDVLFPQRPRTRRVAPHRDPGDQAARGRDTPAEGGG